MELTVIGVFDNGDLDCKSSDGLPQRVDPYVGCAVDMPGDPENGSADELVAQSKTMIGRTYFTEKGPQITDAILPRIWVEKQEG